MSNFPTPACFAGIAEHGRNEPKYCYCNQVSYGEVSCPSLLTVVDIEAQLTPTDDWLRSKFGVRLRWIVTDLPERRLPDRVVPLSLHRAHYCPIGRVALQQVQAGNWAGQGWSRKGGSASGRSEAQGACFSWTGLEQAQALTLRRDEPGVESTAQNFDGGVSVRVRLTYM